MGIENRDYYRGSSTGIHRPSGFSDMPIVCKRLLIACAAMFFVQILFTRTLGPEEFQRAFESQQEKLGLQWLETTDEQIGEGLDPYDLAPDALLFPQTVSIAQEWLSLDPDKVSKGQVWRLITYAFLHDRHGVWHLLVNLLFLYWFGTRLEQIYGSREFCLFYFAAAIVAGVSFLALDYYTGSPATAIGASGAIWGLVALYVIHHPYERIDLYGIFPMEIRWLALIYLVFDLHPVLLAINGAGFVQDGVAHAAHLGGACFGFAYFHRSWRLAPLWNRVFYHSGAERTRARTVRSEPKRVVPRGGSKLSQRSDEASERIDPKLKKLEAQLDAVLDKIQAEGKASLTDKEIEILAHASKQFRDR